MILQLIDQIEHRVREAETLPKERRTDLLHQLAAVRTEARAVPVAGDHDLDLPVRPSIDPHGPIEPIVNQLLAAIDALPAGHPQLAKLANQLSVDLSRSAI